MINMEERLQMLILCDTIRLGLVSVHPVLHVGGWDRGLGLGIALVSPT